MLYFWWINIHILLYLFRNVKWLYPIISSSLRYPHDFLNCNFNFSDFAKYPLSERLSLLCESLKDFSQSILVTAVCLFVCLSVCLSVCLFVCLLTMYRPHRWSDRPEILIEDVFWTKDYAATFFFWKSDKRQGQGHHFCENQIMGHNFWTGSDRDFWLVAERSL